MKRSIGIIGGGGGVIIEIPVYDSDDSSVNWMSVTQIEVLKAALKRSNIVTNKSGYSVVELIRE